MTPHPGVIRDIAHRQRVAATQFLAYVDQLTKLEPYERADLKQWGHFVADAADRLCPANAGVVEGNVVPLPVRAFVPVVAIEEEIWR